MGINAQGRGSRGLGLRDARGSIHQHMVAITFNGEQIHVWTGERIVFVFQPG